MKAIKLCIDSSVGRALKTISVACYSEKMLYDMKFIVCKTRGRRFESDSMLKKFRSVVKLVNTAEKKKFYQLLPQKSVVDMKYFEGVRLIWRFESFCSGNIFVSMVELVDAFGSNPKFYRFESYWRYKNYSLFKGAVNFQGFNLGNVYASLPAPLVQWIRIRDYGSCDEGSNPSWGTQNEITKTRQKIREN